jgi:hypothetical protein
VLSKKIFARVAGISISSLEVSESFPSLSCHKMILSGDCNTSATDELLSKSGTINSTFNTGGEEKIPFQINKFIPAF